MMQTVRRKRKCTGPSVDVAFEGSRQRDRGLDEQAAIRKLDQHHAGGIRKTKRTGSAAPPPRTFAPNARVSSFTPRRAGTFDGIFLTGILAVLLASLFHPRPYAAQPY